MNNISDDCTSCHIVLYHTILYTGTSYRIISYGRLVYHIMSYCIIFSPQFISFVSRNGNDSQNLNNGSENGSDENTENKSASAVRLGKGNYPRNGINSNNTTYGNSSGSVNLSNSDVGKTVKKVSLI